ncbi:MAG: SGNH/GDSL hydrolase family protein [Bacteroidia bacterium]|nr:SGNH/GDSL hydrolase family protein [Bacteroidia bacterium]
MALIELFTRWLYKDFYPSQYEFRMSCPEPYKEAPYFSEEFVKESFKQPGGWFYDSLIGTILPYNFHGKYFNVKDHKRVTTHQPDNFLKYVYVFGGSTIYCSEVPDEHTVCSYLQRKLNQRYPKRYKVINMGASSLNTREQFQKLIHTRIDSGDVVIFYGGVNDALLLWAGDIHQSVFNFQKGNLTSLKGVRKFNFDLFNYLSPYSKFVRIFLNPYHYGLPCHFQDSLKIKKLCKDLETYYIQYIQKAHEFCQSHKACFINILQPQLLTRKHHSEYEKKLLENKFLIPPAWKAALEFAYPRLKISIIKLQKMEIFSVDFSSIFNGLEKEIYLDICHVNEYANSKLADNMIKLFEYIN